MTVLAITSIKGGVGKTTTAVNLAWLSARDGTPSLLWDLDPQGAASFTFRVRPELEVGAGRLLRDEDALADAIHGTDFPGLDLLPADFSCRKLDAILARRGGKGDGLERALRSLAASHERVLLDCPPGFTLLAEAVFSAADALVVPTLPTVLSLRTIARLARHVADRRGRSPLLLPFLSMVDRRREAHRALAEHAQRAGAAAGWLPASVWHASLIEQMGSERAPVGVFAPGSPAAADCERLWDAVLAALAHAGDDGDRRERAARLADDVDALLAAMQPDECAATAPPAPPSAASLAEVSELLRMADVDGTPPSEVEQLHHVFDTPDGALAGAGLSLRLREERGRYAIVAAGDSAEAAGGRDELHAGVDARWAFGILAGERSPLAVLQVRIAGPRPPLVERLARSVGDAPLLRVASLRSVRCRLGPVRAADESEAASGAASQDARAATAVLRNGT
jgi:cellulose biosynthesis protein BcsQ